MALGDHERPREKRVEPHATIGGGRVSVSGPDVIVPPKQALSLSLIFHELATNASKYGALSPGGGELHVEWIPGPEGVLALYWQERTRHWVQPPEHEGFGSKLIRLNVERELGGAVTREFGVDGFSAEIRLRWTSESGEIVSPGEDINDVQERASG